MPQDHPVLERPEHATKPPTVSLLFVYGTLRMGGSNDIRRFGPYSRLLGPARVRGRLHDLGDYPGLVLGGLDWVSGELHAIAPEIEPALDALEEVWPQRTGLYRRTRALVIAGAQSHGALVYEMDRSRAQVWPLIECGDWLTHLGCRAGPRA